MSRMYKGPRRCMYEGDAVAPFQYWMRYTSMHAYLELGQQVRRLHTFSHSFEILFALRRVFVLQTAQHRECR